MTSITNLIRGPDREYFDLFERIGANVLAIAAAESRDIAIRPAVATRSTDPGEVWAGLATGLVAETATVANSADGIPRLSGWVGRA